MCGSKSSSSTTEEKVTNTTTTTNVRDVGLTGNAAVDTINRITDFGNASLMGVTQTTKEGFNRLVGGASKFVNVAANSAGTIQSTAYKHGSNMMFSAQDVIEDNIALTESSIARSQSSARDIAGLTNDMITVGEGFASKIMAMGRNTAQDMLVLSAGQTEKGNETILTRYMPWILISVVAIVGVTTMRK